MNLELLLLAFYGFFKTGLFIFGNSLVTILFLTEMMNKYYWSTTGTLTDMIAVGELTPGAIGINMATYAGYHINSMLGGIAAMLGLVVPDIIMICIATQFLKKFKDSELVRPVLHGIRPAVTTFIASTGIAVSVAALSQDNEDFMEVVKWPCIPLFAVIFCLSNKHKRHPILCIATSAAVGILFQLQNIWEASLPISAANYFIFKTIKNRKIANILIYIKESELIDFNDISSVFIRKRRGLPHCVKRPFSTLLHPCLIYLYFLLAGRFPIMETEGYPTIMMIDIVG